MKTHKIILSLSIACSILLFGCPYESKFSLSNPSESVIDTTLIGLWENVGASNNSGISSMEIYSFNNHEYLVATFGRENGGIMMQNFRSFGSTVNHEKILNIQEVGNSAKFKFYNYFFSNDTLNVAAASDNFSKEQFSTREELMNYFIKNMDDPKFFEGYTSFVKKKR